MTSGDRPDASPRPLIVVLWALTVTGLLLITIVPPGATRIFAWPWRIVYHATLLGPALLLVLRAADARRPLALPSRAWVTAVAAIAAVLIAAAVASPYRQSALQWSAPLLAPLAVFLLTVDALRKNSGWNGDRIWLAYGAGFAAIAIAGLAEWLVGARGMPLAEVIAARNPYPLGHSNYTAGLAVLMLPWFAVRLGRAARRRETPRRERIGAIAGVALALALLLTSASRAGMIALVVLGIVGLFAAPLSGPVKRRIALAGAVVALALVAVHPRTRAMLLPDDADAAPNISNVQRTAMLVAGLRMGASRPLLGWGPGTTPLAFPRFRAGLNGGAENVLELHSLPVQIWAELGLAGFLCAAAAVFLLVRDARGAPIAAVTLAGYGVFALFDAQLDVPVFGYAIAVLAAFIAAAADRPAVRRAATARGLLAGGTLVCLGLVLVLGRRDPDPERNALALSSSVGRAQPQRAIALLRQSLRHNADQEIAHFNLGWLLVVDDPRAAARHFEAAAHLVPDKGGVYFGLGLARLNGGDARGAAQAFALETLNDPVFLLSPWWENPAIAAVRDATLADLARMESTLARELPANTWDGRELRYTTALNAWLAGRIDAEHVAAVADTDARRAFFTSHPDRAAILRLPARSLRHERIGYPVLMRNLDLAPPVDLWVVRESTARDTNYGELWPEKGWLPSPRILALLDAPGR